MKRATSPGMPSLADPQVRWRYTDSKGAPKPGGDLGYSIDAEIRDDVGYIRLMGNVDLGNSMHVAEALVAVRKSLARENVTRAVLDIRKLYFLASSGLKHLANWVTCVGDGTEPRYLITILTDANIHWQKRSLSALAALEPAIVSIQEEP